MQEQFHRILKFYISIMTLDYLMLEEISLDFSKLHTGIRSPDVLYQQTFCVLFKVTYLELEHIEYLILFFCCVDVMLLVVIYSILRS